MPIHNISSKSLPGYLRFIHKWQKNKQKKILVMLYFYCFKGMSLFTNQWEFTRNHVQKLFSIWDITEATLSVEVKTKTKTRTKNKLITIYKQKKNEMCGKIGLQKD